MASWVAVGSSPSFSVSAKSDGRPLIVKSDIPPSGVIATSCAATAPSSAATGVAWVSAVSAAFTVRVSATAATVASGLAGGSAISVPALASLASLKFSVKYSSTSMTDAIAICPSSPLTALRSLDGAVRPSSGALLTSTVRLSLGFPATLCEMEVKLPSSARIDHQRARSRDDTGGVSHSTVPVDGHIRRFAAVWI